MLTDKLFADLVKAASLAPSADNMQPWEFQKKGDTIEVFCARQRVLPTDVIGMFAWVGVGAAIQNMVVAAEGNGLVAAVDYGNQLNDEEPAAIVRFSPGEIKDNLARFIALRSTNRSPYKTSPLTQSLISNLTQRAHGMNAGIHWTTQVSDFESMSAMDAHSSYIRLSHKPLHDELFDILRFTREEVEKTRFGLTFESLEVPSFAVFFARQLKYWWVNRLVSKLGFDRLVAKQLSNKLRKAGAICLVAAHQRDAVGYMEAGQAMEQLWLAATSEGLSIQPYGVLPQYLTKVEIEPETFLAKHATIIREHRERFFFIFPEAMNEYPAIVLRIGHAGNGSARSDIRLRPEQIIRNPPFSAQI